MQSFTSSCRAACKHCTLANRRYSVHHQHYGESQYLSLEPVICLQVDVSIEDANKLLLLAFRRENMVASFKSKTAWSLLQLEDTNIYTLLACFNQPIKIKKRMSFIQIYEFQGRCFSLELTGCKPSV